MAVEQYNYIYPNPKSYALLPVGSFQWQGRTLRHGYIYGYKTAAETGASTPGGTSARRQINYQNYKMFQFNPPGLQMNVTMMNTDSPENEADGGNLGTPAVGLATSGLELFFDRTDEIARSNAGLGSDIWRDVGVQQDLFDFLKVISGGDTSLLGLYTDTNEEGGTVRASSMNRMTGAMFDAAIAGSKVMFKSFVIVFNSNLTVHVQRMTSFSFTYLRFTSDLVPTTVKLEIGLEITNMGTKTHTVQAGASIADPVNPSATAAPPGTSTSPSSVATRNQAV